MSKQLIGLSLAIVMIVSAIYVLELQKPARTAFDSVNELTVDGSQVSVERRDTREEKAKKYPRAKELAGIAGEVNTKNLKIADLLGKKVIMVDFWTYSCINCQRTTPYLNAWYDKYRESGLEIIGVHAPEFEFEKKLENVQMAVEKFGIKYPVVLDSALATWSAYKNQYWPRKYLIDIDGFIVYDHIGEGGYEETEKKIQELLMERGVVLGDQKKISEGVVSGMARGPLLVESPEIYFGAERNEFLGNGRPKAVGEQSLVVSSAPVLNTLYLGGRWSIERESSKLVAKDGRVVFKYRARDVYMVGRSNSASKVRILRDGKPLTGATNGEDVMMKDGVSTVTIQEDRLYKLIQDDGGFGEHVLELIIDEPGVELFTFTFG